MGSLGILVGVYIIRHLVVGNLRVKLIGSPFLVIVRSYVCVCVCVI